MNFISWLKMWLQEPWEAPEETKMHTIVSPKQIREAVNFVRQSSAYARSYTEDEVLTMVWKMVHKAAEPGVDHVSSMGFVLVKSYLDHDEQQIDVLVDPAVGQNMSYKEI